MSHSDYRDEILNCVDERYDELLEDDANIDDILSNIKGDIEIYLDRIENDIGNILDSVDQLKHKLY